MLEVSNVIQSSISLLIFMFASLDYFHVLSIFEGIVTSELALYINHLARKEKHFSCLDLNRHIIKLKYIGNDAPNKPCKGTPGAGKLSGHAIQNWCFLKMLPVLMGNKINNPLDNDVWQLNFTAERDCQS